jgi:hypothetical protein
MVIATRAASRLGVEAGARLQFGEGPKTSGQWAGHRLLLIDEAPAFELSYWCGTCPLLFKRLAGAESRLSLAELQDRLAEGIDELDPDVIERFAGLLPAGRYVPLLLRIQPTLVFPGGRGDYFSEEQTTTWGVNGFWGLPEYPQVPYYRTFQTAIDADAHLFEFVVPMVPPRWNDAGRVRQHGQELSRSDRPTAVAVSTLDVCAPATDAEERDWFEHWGVTHFLLDGHHKLQAAADTGRPLRLLSLLSLEASLADAEQIAKAIEARGREESGRPLLRSRTRQP